MFCEHCHGRVANVHLVRIINGKKNELHLCNECAKGERFKQTENLLNYSMETRIINLLEKNSDPCSGII